MTEPRLRSFDLETVLRDIYAEEGNVSITSFWDCGFTVKIGDRLQETVRAGIIADTARCMTHLPVKCCV
jgi:hypothetical protein